MTLKSVLGSFQSLIMNFLFRILRWSFFLRADIYKDIKRKPLNSKYHDTWPNSRVTKKEKYLSCHGDWKSAESLWHHIKTWSTLARGKFIFWQIINKVWKSGKNLQKNCQCYSNLNSNRKSCHNVSDSVKKIVSTFTILPFCPLCSFHQFIFFYFSNQYRVLQG